MPKTTIVAELWKYNSELQKIKNLAQKTGNGFVTEQTKAGIAEIINNINKERQIKEKITIEKYQNQQFWKGIFFGAVIGTIVGFIISLFL